MKIEFNEQQLLALKAALDELPHRVSAPLLAHINGEIARLYNEQYDRQREPRQEPLPNQTL